MPLEMHDFALGLTLGVRVKAKFHLPGVLDGASFSVCQTSASEDLNFAFQRECHTSLPCE